MGYHEYYNTYNYLDSTVDSIMTGIVAIYLIALLVFALFYVISYVFKGIGMYTIAKRQGRDNPWLAFIPFARTYLHGELAGNISLKNKGIRNPGIWLLVMPFIFGAVNMVFYIVSWVAGIGIFSRMFSSIGYGYGHHSAGLSTGGIMGIIVIILLWSAVSVVYSAVYKVLKALVNRQILERFTSPNMAVAHAVFCFLIPLYESICLFVMRNRPYNPGMEPDFGRPFMQAPPPMGPGAPVPDMPAPGAPVQDMPMPGAPVQDAPKPEMPVQDVPMTETPVQDAPKPEMPVQDVPIPETPVQDVPISETPVQDAEVPEQMESTVSENSGTETAANEQSVIYMPPTTEEETQEVNKSDTES